jgi:tRNA (guanine37-N1)-methyltransferase
MRLDIITIFPGYLAPLGESLIGRAIADGVIELGVHDLRSWTTDRHHSVDDTPYGGGPGMVMRPDVWGRALDDVLRPGSTLVIPTPSGEPFTQRVAMDLSGAGDLVFACGRYEGIDARVARHAALTHSVRELSIGDYVLAGGEAAVLVMVEAVGRLLPGVLGNADSAVQDSFSGDPGITGLLEGPAFTRPVDYRGLAVPRELLSGDHAAIARWRRDESLRRTAALRPDLLGRLTAEHCDAADLDLLLELEVTPPPGLAERVAVERAARAARRRRRGPRQAGGGAAPPS